MVHWHSVNFSGSLTKAGSVELLLFFEDKEGSVFGRLISGDHKIGRIRSPAAVIALGLSVTAAGFLYFFYDTNLYRGLEEDQPE